MNRRGLKLAFRVMALVAGLILVIAAVIVAVRQVDFTVLRQAPPWTVPLLAAAVLANLGITAAIFWVITRSFDADPPVEGRTMLKLITASSLLNYLPLRPGLLGRTVYLKTHHGLPVHQSLLVLLVTLVIGAIVLGVTGAAVLLAPPPWRTTVMAGVLCLLLALSPLAGPLARRLLRRPVVMAWLWVPLRVLDMVAAGGRLWLGFAMVGQPLDFEQALAIAAVGSLIDMLGLTPNGLGLREWAVAGLYALQGHAGAMGLAASLVERGVSAVVIAIAGVIALARLRRNQIICQPRASPS